MRRVRVGPLTDFADTRGVARRAGGFRLAIFRVGDRVFALGDSCPHRGFPLHDGTVSGSTVRCRTHGSCFDLTSGAVERGPAARAVAVYRAEVVDGEVEIELPD